MSAERDVPITVTSRHGHVSDRMQDYATKKAERLLRFHDRISRIEIVVDGPHEAPEVEMIVHLDRADHIVGKERSEHFSSAVDRLSDKMERQLVKAKGKQRAHLHDSIRGMPDLGSAVPGSALPIDGESDETIDDVIRRGLDD